MEALVEVIGMAKEIAGWTQQSLTFETLTSAYPLILYCRSRIILYCKNGVIAGMLIELPCSILLACGEQIDKDLEGLDDLAKNIGNFG